MSSSPPGVRPPVPHLPYGILTLPSSGNVTIKLKQSHHSCPATVWPYTQPTVSSPGSLQGPRTRIRAADSTVLASSTYSTNSSLSCRLIATTPDSLAPRALDQPPPRTWTKAEIALKGKGHRGRPSGRTAIGHDATPGIVRRKSVAAELGAGQPRSSLDGM